MAYALENSERYLNVSLPTLEEHQRRRKIVQVADKNSGGRFAEICIQDGPEESNVRESAEPIVEVDDAPTSPSTAPEYILPKI
jgi:hypothetical protein